MSFYLAPWDQGLEPSGQNVRMWMDNLFTRFQPIEQSRWNQANIDSLFHAGAQSYINRHFNFSPTTNVNQFYFNFIQQPCNLVTGYQRQHRKSINYVPTYNADPHTTDQYTRLITHANTMGGINETYSKACELSAISGMVLLQPYLDYSGDDPAQGDLKVKLWEYNSFMVDPYFREPDMSDCQFVWCQQYITKIEAEDQFGDKAKMIYPMAGSPQRYGNFYFLPENYNLNRNDLLVLSYIWYKWKKKKKRLYNPQTNEFFDFGGGEEQLAEIKRFMPQLQVVEVTVPAWKLAVVLNDQLMFQGFNPLGFDGIPFIMVPWNYDPHLNYFDLRVRSLVRVMRDPQFLFNRRIILNHDISESSINSGWKRKVGAVANEENLKRTGQGFDIVINDGSEMTDVEKIIPNAVPPSDLQLAEQMMSMIFSVSGVNMENWSGQEDSQSTGIAILLKQAANLMVFQKYFDQWDFALKLLGDIELKIALNNWNAAKVSMLIGEAPSPHFFSKIFAKYKVVVAEGLDTAVQQQQEFRQLLELNQMLGGVIPPSYIASKATIQGKAELMQILQQHEQAQAQVQQKQMQLQDMEADAKLKELYSKVAANIATARERHGRAEANVGLFEERLSEITSNRARATKDKMEALEKLLDAIAKYGEMETSMKAAGLETYNYAQSQQEDVEKQDAKRTTLANDFMTSMMGQAQGQ